MKALVVQNSNTMRSTLCRFLSMRGFEVTEAKNGPQALEALQGMDKADLILVEWTSNRAGSLAFLASCRHGSAPDSMIILLAETEMTVRELHSAHMAGADDYLMNPFTPAQIDEKLTMAGLARECDSIMTNGVSIADSRYVGKP